MKNPKELCCDQMRAQLNWKCDEHTSASDCPDALVGRIGANGYGLYIHDGGSSLVEIHFVLGVGSGCRTRPQRPARHEAYGRRVNAV
jgi:hypothetical protein